MISKEEDLANDAELLIDYAIVNKIELPFANDH